MSRMFKSLYSRISVVFLVLLLIMGVIQILFSVQSSLNFVRESDQKLNRTLAQDLAKTFSPFLRDSLDYASIEHTMHDLMVMNPRIEIYLLDEAGRILAFFADPKKKVKLNAVTLEPVRDFLADNENMPILGDDPRHEGREKTFSAAPLQIGREIDGFLYVILGGEQYDSAAQMIRDSYIIRTFAFGLGITLLFTGLIGLVLFAFLTRRFKNMRESVRRFENGDFAQRIETNSQDEIGQLAHAFNQMADTIVANMEELKRTDRLRRDLIANVSHDLRSPLASIQGYLETIQMKKTELTAEQRSRYFQIIYDNTLMLSNLVSELFELSKLDAMQVKPKIEPFSISELTQDVVMKCKPKAEKFNVNLKADLPKDLPAVYADIGMIERALSNLIDNALQYTPQNGTVHVRLSPEKNRVKIAVSDTGYGIPEEEIPLVFDRFYRVEKSRARGSGGTGLGLAITKKILELHQSIILINSAVNKGTTFTFDLQTAS